MHFALQLTLSLGADVRRVRRQHLPADCFRACSFRGPESDLPEAGDRDPQQDHGVDAREHIVRDHRQPSPEPPLETPDGWWFRDIEESEEDEASDQGESVQGKPEEAHQEPAHFIDDNRPRIVTAEENLPFPGDPNCEQEEESCRYPLRPGGSAVYDHDKRDGYKGSPGAGHRRQKPGEAAGSQEDDEIIPTGPLHGCLVRPTL
jgi:hypothetical protein